MIKMNTKGMKKLPRYMLSDLTITEIKDSGKGHIYKATDADGNEFGFKTGSSSEALNDRAEEIADIRRLRRAGVEFLSKVLGIVYQSDGTAVGYLMPWYAKADLREHLEETTYAERCIWSKQLLNAIVQLENEGFNDSSLCLANILLADEGKVVLTSLRSDPMTSQVFLLGCALYHLASGVFLDVEITEEIKTTFPGTIGEIIYQCIGYDKIPTAAEVQRYMATLRPSKSTWANVKGKSMAKG